jgi:hypothetical protein
MLYGQVFQKRLTRQCMFRECNHHHMPIFLYKLGSLKRVFERSRQHYEKGSALVHPLTIVTPNCKELTIHHGTRPLSFQSRQIPDSTSPRESYEIGPPAISYRNPYITLIVYLFSNVRWILQENYQESDSTSRPRAERRCGYPRDHFRSTPRFLPRDATTTNTQHTHQHKNTQGVDTHRGNEATRRRQQACLFVCLFACLP